MYINIKTNCVNRIYTIPQLFSIAPNTLLIATTPLNGYSEIDINPLELI